MNVDKAKILFTDPINRWKKGEIGIILKNDFNKYDYKIELPGKRIYYFFKEEVKIL